MLKQSPKSAVSLIAAMCLAEVLNMVGIFAFPALLPEFTAIWDLSNTEAGWISGIYFAGYTVSVPILAGLTDRIDPRRIYLGSSVLGIMGSLGFALLAEGFWSALVFRILAGFGLAGTFIPGLKALVDRLDDEAQPRAISFYTATFSLGTALSFFAAGFLSSHFGWGWAFGFAAVSGVLALCIAARALGPQPPRQQQRRQGHILDFRPVLRNRQTMGYILAYTAHTWELFAVRSWVVAFLAFSLTLQPEGAGAFPAPSTVASLTALVAMWASVAGAELAVRFGRHRILRFIMWGSAVYACTLGFLPSLPYPVLALLCMGYFLFVQGDSAALHTATIQSARADQRGLTMALQSLIGFGGAFVGPLVVGLVLDLTGGGTTTLSWGAAFMSMGLVIGLGPFLIHFFCKNASIAEETDR
ncbi:MAG: MFS transporter [Desulfohalobiaceae bacterium]|nr:MFS transporter [Desulfohalobiaceae bacterium]